MSARVVLGVVRRREGDFAAVATSLWMRGTRTRRSPLPRYWVSSMAYTSVSRICRFRNSTIALNSNGIRSATNSSRI
ncbi:hypothetical protein ACWDAO_37455 [Streptomyces sp. NPDC001212]